MSENKINKPQIITVPCLGNMSTGNLSTGPSQWTAVWSSQCMLAGTSQTPLQSYSVHRVLKKINSVCVSSYQMPSNIYERCEPKLMDTGLVFNHMYMYCIYMDIEIFETIQMQCRSWLHQETWLLICIKFMSQISCETQIYCSQM